MSTPRGRFVWYELMTSDAKAAEAFYCKVVGWSARDAGMAQPYTLFTLGAGEQAPQVAGLMTTPAEAAAAGARPAWNGYIAVDDVDGDTRRITESGGRICVPPTDIPEVGRFAMLWDPQGASFALFRPLREGPPPDQPAPGTPGTGGWHELHTSDLKAATAFYTTTFGWTLDEAMDMGEAGPYQLFRIGDQQSGGIMTKSPEQPVPAWNFYFNVDHIEAAVARLREAGGQVLNGPMQVPGGSWIVNALDPQGAAFSLVAPGQA